MENALASGILSSPDILGYAAGTVFAIGYIMVNQVRLRLMVLLGSGLYILYYAVAASEPLWAAIYMSLLMAAANVVGLVKLCMSKSRHAIPKAYRDLYPRFKELQPGDFASLVRHARRETVSDGTLMTEQGAPVETLYYVISGAMFAEKTGERFSLPAGVFVGEVAYMTKGRSAATTEAASDLEVLAWDFATLRKRTARDPRFKLALEATLCRDLAVKVSCAVAPRSRHVPANTQQDPRSKFKILEG